MPDYTPRQAESLPETMRTRYLDQLDGTNALVVALGPVGAWAGPIDIEIGGVEPQLDDIDKIAVSMRFEGAGAPGDTAVSETAPLPVDDIWTVAVQEDLTIPGSDKVITVPAGRLWQVLWIWIELTTDGTVGNRQLQVDFRSTVDVIGQVRPNATQAASLLRNYMIAPAIANLTAFYDTDHLQTPLPPTVFLPAGYSVRVFDNNAVAVAGDNMLLHVMIAEKLA